VLANFLSIEGQIGRTPSFPFLCLTVSGGHTQIVKVTSSHQMEIIGQTLDDAAGEAFDKIAKVLELPYPGGPLIDKYALSGNPKAFHFPVANLPGLNYSFSGLKTSVLYFLKKQLVQNPAFITQNRDDLCASVQYTIVKTLLLKLKKAAIETGINNIAIAGGVSANSGLRKAITEEAVKSNWQVHIPPLSLCTDNGGMICLAAYFKYLAADFSTLDVAPSARFGF